MDYTGSMEPDPHPLLPIDKIDNMVIIEDQTISTAVPTTNGPKATSRP